MHSIIRSAAKPDSDVNASIFLTGVPAEVTLTFARVMSSYINLRWTVSSELSSSYFYVDYAVELRNSNDTRWRKCLCQFYSKFGGIFETLYRLS